MHIADGVLPPAFWGGGLAGAAAVVHLSLRRLDHRRIPEIGVLTGLFFVASLIRVPLPLATSAHLMLTGLLGIVLGRLSVVSILVGLTFQAVLVGHGGLTTIGVNTLIAGAGALTSHTLFRRIETLWRARRAADSTPRTPAAAAFVASLGGFLASALCLVSVMAGAGEGLLRVAEAAVLFQLPLMVLDAVVTAVAIAFVFRVRPELLEVPLQATR